MDSLISLTTCEHCGQLKIVGCECRCTTAQQVTYTWICPKCGAHCSTYGFCMTCGWWASSAPQPQRAPWKCPGCGRYHAPHIDTCPYCQPHMAPVPQPYTVPSPYIGDPIPSPYIGDPIPSPFAPPWWTTTTTGCSAEIDKDIYVGDPPETTSSGNTVSSPASGIFLS